MVAGGSDGRPQMQRISQVVRTTKAKLPGLGVAPSTGL